MDGGSSTYRFTPKAPDQWKVKTVRRGDIEVRLIKLRAWQNLACEDKYGPCEKTAGWTVNTNNECKCV